LKSVNRKLSEIRWNRKLKPTSNANGNSRLPREQVREKFKIEEDVLLLCFLFLNLNFNHLYITRNYLFNKVIRHIEMRCIWT
jgi:hypothetical protein